MMLRLVNRRAMRPLLSWLLLVVIFFSIVTALRAYRPHEGQIPPPSLIHYGLSCGSWAECGNICGSKPNQYNSLTEDKEQSMPGTRDGSASDYNEEGYGRSEEVDDRVSVELPLPTNLAYRSRGSHLWRKIKDDVEAERIKDKGLMTVYLSLAPRNKEEMELHLQKSTERRLQYGSLSNFTTSPSSTRDLQESWPLMSKQDVVHLMSRTTDEVCLLVHWVEETYWRHYLQHIPFDIDENLGRVHLEDGEGEGTTSVGDSYMKVEVLGGSWIVLRKTPVRYVEYLFQCSLNVFEVQEKDSTGIISRHFIFRVEEEASYTLPKAVVKLVSFVGGIQGFSFMDPRHFVKGKIVNKIDTKKDLNSPLHMRGNADDRDDRDSGYGDHNSRDGDRGDGDRGDGDRGDGDNNRDDDYTDDYDFPISGHSPRAFSIPVFPQLIRQLYSIPRSIPSDFPQSSASFNNTQCVASFNGNYFSYSDLHAFCAKYQIPNAVINTTGNMNVTDNWNYPYTVTVLGENDPFAPTKECSLDIQYLYSLTNGSIPTFVLQQDDSSNPIRPAPKSELSADTAVYTGPDEPFLEYLINLGKLDVNIYVHSISYSDIESSLSYAYAERCNVEFMKYSLMGYSFLTASGDWGVGCDANDDSLGSSSQGPSCTTFDADFPSTSPYVTSVGSTYLEKLENGGHQENGVHFSSGGFSNYFERPYYQQLAVTSYLLQHDKSGQFPSSSSFNHKGRAFPDISAIGVAFQIIFQNNSVEDSGTSASCPTIAAIVSLINTARSQHGMPPLGWLGPFFYSVAQFAVNGFQDITSCQPQDKGCCKIGFPCAVGWDPYTGLGTPNYPELASAALSGYYL